MRNVLILCEILMCWLCTTCAVHHCRCFFVLPLPGLNLRSRTWPWHLSFLHLSLRHSRQSLVMFGKAQVARALKNYMQQRASRKGLKHPQDCQWWHKEGDLQKLESPSSLSRFFYACLHSTKAHIKGKRNCKPPWVQDIPRFCTRQSKTICTNWTVRG